MAVSRKAATGTLVSGIVVAGIGIILLLGQLGIVESGIIWRFWPAVFCIIGVVRMMEANSTGDQIWGGFFVSLGAILILHEFGYIRYGIGQLWPLFMIVAGLLLAWQANEVREGRKGFCLPRMLEPRAEGGGGPLSSVAIFGGIERRLEGIVADGGNLLAFFGGFKIDLSHAEIEGERMVIDATAIFGGGEIIIPEWWKVSVEGLGIFGGYVDKTRHVPRPDRPVKTVVVRGAAVFGGIEVKSY